MKKKRPEINNKKLRKMSWTKCPECGGDVSIWFLQLKGCCVFCECPAEFTDTFIKKFDDIKE